MEGYLLVAATFSAAQHEAIFQSFSALNPSKVIATKIDESRQPAGDDLIADIERFLRDNGGGA